MKHCPICGRSFPSEETYCSIHGLPLIHDLVMEGGAKGELSGTVLENRYRIGGLIGSGGMGVVYMAEHLRIGRRCAIKVLYGYQAADPKVRMRFFREVRATSRVRHPNVVEILDFGEDDDVGCYMVMEYLEGISLRRIINNESPLPLAVACSATVQLCAALSATHGQGLIHRDLKPANAMRLSNGTIKVLDFGLVKPVETAQGEPTVTTGSMLVGTPWFMSPEHCQGKVLDGRADIYSLGVILYEMLTGQLPFQGTHPFELITKQLNDPVPLPASLDPPVKVPPRAELIMLKALAKDRNARYQSMLEFADAIYDLADEEGVTISEFVPVTTTLTEKRAKPKKDTMRWAGGPAPTVAPAPPLHKLQEIAKSQEEEIVDNVFDSLLEAFPRCKSLDLKDLRRGLKRAMSGAIRALVMDSETEISEIVNITPDETSEEQLTLNEVITALWLAYSVWRPVLFEASNNDMAQYQVLSEQFDRRILPFFFHVTERYVAAFQRQLQRLNQTLARQNEELQDLRTSLSKQVEQTARQLAETERLKARVVESVSSGIILIERNTRRVLLWNKAAERLSGINASQILGETIDSIAHFIEGVPFDEFTEQVRFHHEVGLRKLRLTFKGKEHRTVYVRGQPLYGASDEHLGTVFVLEDVTEREQIIESLGRYLSRDLVTQLISKTDPPRPEAEQRRAVVVTARITNLHTVLDELAPQEVVRLMSDYVRSISHAVFQRGGTIERISSDGLLAYFARIGKDLSVPIHAAVELAGRLKQVGRDLGVKGARGLNVAIGLHVGDILVLNVGGKQYMIQTVVGETTRVAEALLDGAVDGSILATAELAEEASEGLAFKEGPEVHVPGSEHPIKTLCLMSSPLPDYPSDPTTLISKRPPEI